MNSRLRYVHRWLLLVAIFFIAGCASTTRTLGTFSEDSSHWQGRMALKVMTDPPQAFSADFELEGTAAAGSLVLSTALGSTLARIQWDGTSATLQTQGAPQQFDSLAALLRHTIGTDIPVSSLFAWLQGKSATASDWESDLSQVDIGRLTARRTSTREPAEIKIILDR